MRSFSYQVLFPAIFGFAFAADGCPDGQQLVAGRCETIELLQWEPCICSREGNACARAVKVHARCPPGFFLHSADTCRLQRELPFERFCPEGYALEEDFCKQYRGIICEEGEKPTVDGLCVTGLRVPPSYYCPTGDDFRYYYDVEQQVCLLESVREGPTIRVEPGILPQLRTAPWRIAEARPAEQLRRENLPEAKQPDFEEQKAAEMAEEENAGQILPLEPRTRNLEDVASRTSSTAEDSAVERKLYPEALAPAVNAYVGCAVGVMYDIVEEGPTCLINAVARIVPQTPHLVPPTIVCDGEFDYEQKRCYTKITVFPEYLPWITPNGETSGNVSVVQPTHEEILIETPVVVSPEPEVLLYRGHSQIRPGFTHDPEFRVGPHLFREIRTEESEVNHTEGTVIVPTVKPPNHLSSPTAGSELRRPQLRIADHEQHELDRERIRRQSYTSHNHVHIHDGEPQRDWIMPHREYLPVREWDGSRESTVLVEPLHQVSIVPEIPHSAGIVEVPIAEVVDHEQLCVKEINGLPTKVRCDGLLLPPARPAEITAVTGFRPVPQNVATLLEECPAGWSPAGKLCVRLK